MSIVAANACDTDLMRQPYGTGEIIEIGSEVTHLRLGQKALAPRNLGAGRGELALEDGNALGHCLEAGALDRGPGRFLSGGGPRPRLAKAPAEGEREPRGEEGHGQQSEDGGGSELHQ